MNNPSRTDTKRLSLFITAGLVALHALPAAAQTTPAAEETLTLPTLEVTGDMVATDSSSGTKINTPLVLTPQSISVVTRGEMDARGVQNLNEAVSYSAGVTYESFGTDSRNSTVRIRGYEVAGLSNNKSHLDGLRAGGGGQWTGFNFDTFGLERVEVVKGSAGVLYGQVTPGGLLNLISKRPDASLQNSVGVQYSSHDTLQGTIDVGGSNKDESLVFRVAGLGRDGGSEVDHTDLRRTFVAPSLTWNITDQTRLTLLTQYQQDDGGSTYQFLPITGTLVAGPQGYMSPGTFIGEPDWNNYERTQYALGYQFEHEINPVFTVRQSLRYAYADSDYKGVVTGGDVIPGTTTVARRAIWGYGESDNLSADLHLQSKFSTGSVDHTLLTGADFYRSDWDHVRAQAGVGAIDIYNPVYTGLTPAQLAALATPVQDFRVTEQQLGVYLQEQAVIGKLHATLGLRHDTYEIDFRNATNGATADITPTATTWRGGLLYAFESGISPYVSYANSFDTANYTNLDINLNPLDEALESEQWEIGVKYKPRNLNALFTAAAFQLTEENRASLMYSNTAPGNPHPGNNIYSQVGEARTRGVELESRVELLKGFDVIASWTYLDTEIRKSDLANNPPVGNELGGVPEQIASLWLGYTFADDTPFGGLYLGAGVRHVSAFFGTDANTANLRVPSHTLYDAAIGYDFGKKFAKLDGFSARLSATNLEDKRYVTNATAVSAAYYGSGRNVALSVRYAW